MKEYELVENSFNPPPAKKRKYDDLEDDEENDFRAKLHHLAAKRVNQNEFDRYIELPIEDSDDLDILEWWKLNEKVYFHLARMARDVYAVPATGAGVERQFSKSGRVVIWARALLNPDAICETMMYKDYLDRTDSSIASRKHRIEIFAHDKDDENDNCEDAEEKKMI